MRKIKGIQVMGLYNIPRNIATGYKNLNSGKVYNKNGTFLLHTSNRIEGQNDKDTSLSIERTGHYSVEFSELPCDEQGNILVISYFVSTTDNYYYRLSILCSKEPTHRINLITGEITDNNSDNEYIKKIVVSYLVYDKDSIAI